MKMFLSTILLCVAIILIAFGIHTNNHILGGIGGFFVGVYNSMMHETKLKAE